MPRWSSQAARSFVPNTEFPSAVLWVHSGSQWYPTVHFLYFSLLFTCLLRKQAAVVLFNGEPLSQRRNATNRRLLCVALPTLAKRKLTTSSPHVLFDCGRLFSYHGPALMTGDYLCVCRLLFPWNTPWNTKQTVSMLGRGDISKWSLAAQSIR